ncbi:hypothetical protein Adt_30848 [Abeliophyllum distichum]|uniref:Uncharacterized protein n=1 Tax=Abeliophyllum distichum TaxID=126358 RepID=A0ABD1RCE4_9LAMI
MVEEREEQTQQACSSGVAVNEHDVVLKVLGERRGHRRAVGRVSEGYFPLSLVQYDIAGPTQYQSIYSGNQCIEGIQLSTPPPPPPPPPLLSPMHEEELDSSNDEDYLSDL